MKLTDCELIMLILTDGKWHNVIDIMRQGKPGAVNWAVRSRISDLNRKFSRDRAGFFIESRIDVNRQAKYRLITCERYIPAQPELQLR